MAVSSDTENEKALGAKWVIHTKNTAEALGAMKLAQVQLEEILANYTAQVIQVKKPNSN